LAPTGTIGLLMDCDTTGAEPDFALVKFKKLAGGGYFKIANGSLEPALKTLGYTEEERQDILRYVLGTLSLTNAPHINRQSLAAKGLGSDDLDRLETLLPGVFELPFAFNAWSLGEEGLRRLGLSMEEATRPGFDVLRAIGFSRAEIDEANEVVCGTMTVEGAPHLKPEHYPVFDTANTSGRKGTRLIHASGHIRMMAAAQSFLSGAISKTINMPHTASIDDVQDAYWSSWELGVKAMAIYRDGSKMSQPLASRSDVSVADDAAVQSAVATAVEEATARLAAEKDAEIATLRAKLARAEAHPTPSVGLNGQVAMPGMPMVPFRRKLPAKRHGFTQEARIAGHKIYLRTGEYEDGTLGEIFIDMHKEGAAFRSMINSFAIAVSKGLQYGVPLEEFVDSFTFVRFEPQGLVAGHPNIKLATSVIDFVFRVLGMEYLGRTDLVQVADGSHPVDQTGEDHDLLPGPSANGRGVGSSPAQRVASPAAPSIAVSAPTPSQPHSPTVATMEPPSAIDAQLGDLMGDAPFCDVCGHITVRNGSCYKCLNCGNSLGCS
jgi:ribonucleoside-diphosphate reductase alpha chain